MADPGTSADRDPSCLKEPLLVMTSEERRDIRDKVDKVHGFVDIDSKTDVSPPRWCDDDTGDGILRPSLFVLMHCSISTKQLKR